MQISQVLANSKLSRLDAEVLLADTLRISQTKIFINSDREIDQKDLVKFLEFEKLRLAGKSVAAILGSKEFFGLEFEVDENVLIPRPETEILVEEILKIEPQTLLEIGTGSGAIVIAVKKNLENCEVLATDISPEALAIAQKNAAKLNVEINFLESDLLENVSQNFEMIVANLPYLPKNSTEVESGVKKFEPSLALFSGQDGLDLIKKLLNQIAKLSEQPKFILLEFGGEKQVEPLRNFVQKTLPKFEIEFLPDLAGIQRVLKLVK